MIRQGALAAQGPLRRDAGLGGVAAESVPDHEPVKLLFWIAVHQPDFTAERLQTSGIISTTAGSSCKASKASANRCCTAG